MTILSGRKLGCPKNVGDLPVSCPSQSPGGPDVAVSDEQCRHHLYTMDHKLKFSDLGTRVSWLGIRFRLTISRSDAPLSTSFFPVTGRDSIQFHQPTTFNVHVRGYRYVPLSVDAISILMGT